MTAISIWLLIILGVAAALALVAGALCLAFTVEGRRDAAGVRKLRDDPTGAGANVGAEAP
ncbi:MAG: hypothetical protein ABWZ80_01355 [Beijerinckiaceae bacterium]